MRRYVVQLLLVGSLLLIATSGRGEDQPAAAKRFAVEGLFSIDAGADGLAWKELAFPAPDAKVKGRLFLLTKEGERRGATLTVVEMSRDTDAEKIATLKAHYNTPVLQFKSKGFKIIKAEKPPLEAPMPKRSDFSIVAELPSGDHLATRIVTIYEKDRYYLLQAFGPSEEAAVAVAKIIDSLKLAGK